MRRNLCLVLSTILAAVSLVLLPNTASAAAGGELAYVAIGSSFAAGPGIPSPQPSSPGGCSRSTNNYASVLAHDLGAGLVDASCSGATTANVLTTSQAGQPPQADLVTAATKLVTVTIGGNDVNYLGSLGAYSCQDSGSSGCGTVDTAAIDRAFGELPGRLRAVVDRVRARAPQATVLLVEYFTLLPDSGACAGVPLTSAHLDYERGIAARLAAATSDAATATGARLVGLASASHGHDACAADPWVEKYAVASGKSSYHPNANGMRAAAHLIERELDALAITATGPIRSAFPGKCLVAPKAVEGTAIELTGCADSANQQWTKVKAAPEGTLRALGGCLDVKGGGTANHTAVQWWSCNGTGAQRWVPDARGGLVNPQSGRCLDLPEGASANGTRLQIFDCNGTAAQRWTTAG
ncbi:GDSL-type esterase/lipase family protein [Umezawaea endophytica]|uniref:GDSL-type esterase/lipase family protein n=1 Tax=Umezawaea endophytica TaxID=1654476 RepID=A0A9X2VKA0_9PSEU|nr:ricin-type beta-trefoil lectin domain protein [Umezawaea endophytica]MCS7477654.1 GDSL-type esterase/lipase family protein [Umezawaea endophytica]